MVLYQHKNTRLLIYGFLGVAFMCASFLAFYYNPVEVIIESKLALRNGSLSFQLWQKPPLDVYLSAYVFNVTNAEAFERGEDTKLNFEQIGPFVYQEYLEHKNAKFNDNGTISFEPVRKVKFIPERSIGNPKDFVVHVPNLALLGILSALDQSSILLNIAVNQLATYLDSKPILNLTVQEFLWGYHDPLIKLASSVLPSWIDFEKLGILDRMFDDGKNVVTMTIDPTIKPSTNPLLTEEERHRPYAIQLWNGSPGLAHWGYVDKNSTTTHKYTTANSRCNLIEGVYDGAIFPRHITPQTKFRVYRKAFCRTLAIEFDHEGKSPDGFKGYFYRMSPDALDKPENNEDNKCYCKKRCLPPGLSNITPCYYGIPTAVSQPHFYNTDPVVFDKISGLRPNKEDHDIFIILHPDIGVPLWAKSRMQINLVVRDTKYNARTKPYNNMILPIFWTELAILEVPKQMRLLVQLIEIAPLLQLGAIILFSIIGLTLFMISLIGFFWLPRFQSTPSSEKPLSTATLHVNYTPVKILTTKSCEALDCESSCLSNA